MRTRLRAEAGMGLVELLIAMTILAVALLALVAAFSSGALTLQRASQTSTASALANQQMETYRGLKYADVRLEPASIPGAADPYQSDVAYTCCGAQVTSGCTASPWPDPCDASQTPAAPDNRAYRVDSYVVYETPSGGRQLKKVTVVVRDGNNVTGRVLARTSSKFDQVSG
jgi:type II secretory pathway pseudopilin PulG